MINSKFFICTECQKTKKKKPRQFRSLRGFNIHLAITHSSKYKVNYQKGKFSIIRLKRAPKKNNLLT